MVDLSSEEFFFFFFLFTILETCYEVNNGGGDRETKYV